MNEQKPNIPIPSPGLVAWLRHGIGSHGYSDDREAMAAAADTIEHLQTSKGVTFLSAPNQVGMWIWKRKQSQDYWKEISVTETANGTLEATITIGTQRVYMTDFEKEYPWIGVWVYLGTVEVRDRSE